MNPAMSLSRMVFRQVQFGRLSSVGVAAAVRRHSLLGQNKAVFSSFIMSKNNFNQAPIVPSNLYAKRLMSDAPAVTPEEIETRVLDVLASFEKIDKSKV